jgi:hypothetical protein
MSSSTWSGSGQTRTAPSCTLYCAPLPPSVPVEAVRGLFSSSSDFLSFRTVRGMVFIDFTSEAGALAAMRRHQGALACPPSFPGLALDFDKDKREKRNSAYERSRTGSEKDVALFCVLCHCPALFLAAGCRLDSLPRRGTDGAHVVDEASALRSLSALEGQALLLRREGGRAERQVPLCCKQCRVRWGYRPTPLGTPAQYLYIHDKALTHSLRGGEEGHLLRVEAKAGLKRLRGEGEGGAAEAAEGQQQQQQGAAAAAAAVEEAAEGEAVEAEAGPTGEGTEPATEPATEQAEAPAAVGEQAEEEGGEGYSAAVVPAPAEPTNFTSEQLARRFEKFLSKKAKVDGN